MNNGKTTDTIQSGHDIAVRSAEAVCVDVVFRDRHDQLELEEVIITQGRESRGPAKRMFAQHRQHFGLDTRQIFQYA